MNLEESGRKVLEVLVPYLKKVIPGKPETYVGYKKVHDQLNLTYLGPTWGESLNKQGLGALAEWTFANNFPGITGIVISTETYKPGKGYFTIFKKDEMDYQWWTNEVKISKEFDWSIYIQEEFDLMPADIDVPDREDIKISRIIRDSELSKKIKFINNFECQICGLAINMPAGKKYAEAHHIKPIGKPHNGPDVIENMICVCPNHHAMLDYGAMKLSVKDINMEEGHSISKKYIEYHNEIIFKP